MVSLPEKLKKNPLRNANVFSKLFFWWLKGIFYEGSTRDLQIHDLCEPIDCDRSEVLGDQLEREWCVEVAKPIVNQSSEKSENLRQSPSLLRCIVRVFFWPFLFQGILIFLQWVVFHNLQTVFFGWLITYFNPKTQITKKQAYLYAAGVVATAIGASLTGCHGTLGVERIGMKIRVACSSLVYRKMLRLSKTSLGQTTSGQILNLLSNDLQRFDFCLAFLHWIWLAPIQLILISYLVWQNVGIVTLAGTGAMLLQTVPLQGYLSRLTSKFRKQIANETDKRVQFMSELISGIQVIKMCAWEKVFEQVASNMRTREIQLITSAAYCRGLYHSVMVFGQRVTLFVTLVIMILIGNNVNAEIIFTTTAYWQLLHTILAVFFPLSMTFASEVLVSIQRLEEFLQLEEYKGKPENSSVNVESSNDQNITIEKVSANWICGTSPPTLHNVNFEVKQSQLCALIGPIGSGKSSILQLILGELQATTGTLTIGGKVISYAAQEAWLFTGTIKENILFGLPYVEKKYDEVTKVCALKEDFRQLSRGDLTFVGERGASLSGGQRARINLARAVYRDADIYLLDDPLSAVDTHVGRQLFGQCIDGYLRGKTRILVTHQLQYLKNSDTIVLLKNGSVDSQGTFDELTSSNPAFDSLMKTFFDAEEKSNGIAKSTGTQWQHPIMPVADKEPELLEEEELGRGQISFEIYKEYFRAGGSIVFRMSMVLIIIVTQLVNSGIDYWVIFLGNQKSLKQSLNHTDFRVNSPPYDNNTWNVFTNVEYCIAIYGGLIVLCVVLSIIRNTIIQRLCINSSKVLYRKMLANLMQATMRFFNTNPSGRILNRFSKDIGAIDEMLPNYTAETLSITSMTIGALFVIIISNYWVIIPLVVLGGIINIAGKYYLAIAHDIKRLEAAGRSPVFSHVNYSLEGLTTIRSSESQQKMIQEFDNRQNFYISAWFLFLATGNAFGFFVDTIIAIFIALICFSFLIANNGDTISGSFGLAISQSLGLSDAILFGIKSSVRAVSEMTSVERVFQYTKLPVEEPFVSTVELPPNWPQFGAIQFQDLSLKYDDTKPAVLKNINIHINPGQKIGIVGRTGAGKSSIVAALLRMANLEGRITIDGIDTQSIGLHDLRSKISVIPQAPILFSGTLRYNLDPCNEFSDDHLWAALDELRLKEAFTSLDCEIEQGGNNLSLGNRQLLCLARAVLRNNKILVLDEATANIDHGTDALIQATIREKFAAYTVLTIAHRIGTIMDSDRVLILDAGRVVEFGDPCNLLKNPNGHFTRMVRGTGNPMTEYSASA